MSDAPSNTRTMQQSGTEPEILLRNALAVCAEMRSRGVEPYLVVLIGEDRDLPMMQRSSMYDVNAAACLARLQLEVAEMFREAYS